MTVTISIPDDVGAKLRERATAVGEAVPQYTARLVEQAVKAPTLEELLAPVQADFARSGMTQAEFLEFGRGLLEKARGGTSRRASRWRNIRRTIIFLTSRLNRRPCIC